MRPSLAGISLIRIQMTVSYHLAGTRWGQVSKIEKLAIIWLKLNIRSLTLFALRERGRA